MAELPNSSKGDVVHALTKGVISSVPVIGNIAGEIFGLIVAAPITNRQKEWTESVESRLKELMQQKSLTIEDLEKNKEFVSILLRASRLAIQNHENEKLEAFRNAVLNTATPSSPDEALRHMFLNLIDVFTIWHIRLLRLFVDPPKWFADHNLVWPDSHFGGSLDAVIYSAFHELRGKNDFLTQVCKDLRDSGLAHIDFSTMMTGTGMRTARTAPQGLLFLQFIDPPKS